MSPTREIHSNPQNSANSVTTPRIKNGKPWSECETMDDADTLDTSSLIDFPPLVPTGHYGKLPAHPAEMNTNTKFTPSQETNEICPSLLKTNPPIATRHCFYLKAPQQTTPEVKLLQLPRLLPKSTLMLESMPLLITALSRRPLEKPLLELPQTPGLSLTCRTPTAITPHQIPP
jgi:hypothetical protein